MGGETGKEIAPKKLTEQFELIEKQIDAETTEILGVRCRWCSYEVIDQKGAQEIMRAGGLAVLTTAVAIRGGLHWLFCEGPRGN